MDQRFHLAKNKSSNLPCLSMLTLLKHAYSTRLKSSKHAKMSAIEKAALVQQVKASLHVRLQHHENAISKVNISFCINNRCYRHIYS